MSPVQSQGKYYGGDKYDENDEESIKLLLKDCHQRQSKLFSVSALTSSHAAFVLSPLTKGELLYSSGQSRFHLYLRETELLTQPSADQSSTSPADTTLDFVTFKMKVPESAKIPTFPSSLEREVSAFRSHGLPLLVWPRTRDKATLQKYLDDNYPDCARWFSELDRTLTWLEEKWLPLSAYLGLELPPEYPTSPKTKCLRGLSEDCVAFKLIKTRTTWCISYVNLLKSYLMHRRLATPGFHRNPIHHQLANLCKDRSSDLPNDSGFFNVVGNRLLQLGHAAEANGKSVELKIEDMAKTIEDSQKRAHFLSVLLPVNDLKDVLSSKKPSKRPTADTPQVPGKAALMAALDSSSDDEDDGNEEEMDVQSEGSGDSDGEPAEEAADQVPKPKPTQQFPNRPVTKEIMENKGILKYRHKRERNPRVHLRHKFRKAQIRYRSRVPEVRKEDTPYAGELRGIRVNLIKSHKFKKPK